MLKTLRVIAGDLRNLYALTALNILHLLLKGVPFGILFLVILELLKPREDISVATLVWLFAFMAAAMVANIFLAVRVHVFGYIEAYDLTTRARLRLGDHLRKLSLGFFKRRDPGDISALLLQDMTKTEMIFAHYFMDAIACLVLPALLCVFFLLTDVRMTGVLLASLFLSFPALLLAQRLITHFGKKHIRSRNETASRMLEYLQGINVLKAFGMTGKGFERLDKAMLRLRDDSIRLESFGGMPIMLFGLVLDVGFAALLVFGAWLLSQGEIAVASFVLFLVIGPKFFEPFLSFGTMFSEMRYMTIAAGRIAEVLEVRPLEEGPNPRLPESHDIRFEKVAFSYNGSARVLRGIDFDAPRGAMTALVGPSGSGKTTITSLMARFWDVDEGRITIGGVDVRDIPNHDLNALFSVVFQDVYLFQGTVLNNIRVGKKDATREEVMDAARRARCHDFIEAMEKGYDTRVGEGGATLSGGEKQRISIARALLKDAPIVILDEATASLDPENELQIQEAIAAVVRSKTLIVIAHRLKTIAAADQILVLDKGLIRERGVHAQLLDQGGLYAHLWQEQQRAGGWKFSKSPRPRPGLKGAAA